MVSMALGPNEWAAILLSLQVAVVATVSSIPIAVLVAYALARWSFPGKALLNGLVHLPLVLPPVVTGYLLLLSMGTQGPIGGLLAEIGIVFAFRWTGAALAAAVLVVDAVLVVVPAISVRPSARASRSSPSARVWPWAITLASIGS